MITLSQALQEVVYEDGFLHFGISNGLLNLTQTSKWIRPLIETRLQKTLSNSAIIMALSRMANQKKKVVPKKEKFKLSRVNVHKDLCELTFAKTSSLIKRLPEIQSLAHEKHAYIAITQGADEVTMIVASMLEKDIRKTVQKTPIFYKKNLSALGMQFDAKYVWDVGFFYHIVQQVTLQNINILEFSSTYTELIFFLDEKDLNLAFNTVYSQFM